MIFCEKTALHSKRGIALVVVLGFLSIILLLAVAFVITMRTERLATRNYLDFVKARFMMQVALARTVDELDQYIDPPGVSFYMGMDKPVFFSLNSPDTNKCGDLLTGQTTNYIPRSLWSFASLYSQSVLWTNIVEGTNLVGRFAFLAVDCSGLLDLSTIGGLTRSNGVDAREITLDANLIPEVINVANLTSRRDNIASDRIVRFETLAELNQLGHAAPAFLWSGLPSNVFVYSYFPAGQFLIPGNPPQIGNAVYIGGDQGFKTNVQLRAAILSNFTAMGVAQASDAAQNLIDYLDTDFEPNLGIESFGTEPVPMINEIVITNTVAAYPEGTNDVYDNRFDITVELWYPFVGFVNTSNYTLEIQVICQGGTPDFCPRQVPAIKVPVFSNWPGASRYRLTNVVVKAKGFKSTTPPSWPDKVAFDFKLREGNNDPSRPIVDAIKASTFVENWADRFVTTMPNPLSPGQTNTIPPFRKETDDPRINWDWQNHWSKRGADHTIGKENQLLTYSDPILTNMYVRNAPNLPTVGELAFLLCSNQPWATIRLLDPGSLPILDRFTVTTNTVLKGLVNLNTANSNVLATAFMDAPPERWPGEIVTKLTRDQAGAAAGAFATNSVTRDQWMNLSDIAKASSLFTNALGGLDLLQQYGVLRNTAGLLSTRQNLFTIVLAVQSVEDVDGDKSVDSDDIRAEQRAVVIVWRDPYPDASGRHPTFVRLFRWMTE